MSNFPTQNKDHVAGLRSFEWVEVDQVISHPEPSEVEIAETDIILQEGAEWFNGAAAFNSLSHSEQEQETEHGNYYENEVGGFYVGDSKEIRQRFRAMRHKRFLLKVRDNEGRIRLIGTKEEPLRLRSDFGSATIGGRKGFRFTFYNAQIERSLFITQFGQILMINDQGDIIQIPNTHTDTFTLDPATGDLIVTGPNEEGYSLNEETGEVYFDVDQVSL